MQKIIILFTFLFANPCYANSVGSCTFLQSNSLKVAYSDDGDTFEKIIGKNGVSSANELEDNYVLTSLWENQFSSETLLPFREIEKTEGARIGKPFDIRNDYLAVAVYKQNSYTANSLILVDMKADIIESKVGLGIGQTVFDIKFNKEASYIAVAFADYVIDDGGILQSIASKIGHPINYWNFFISIYNRKGSKLCSFELASKIEKPMISLSWKK